jgi:hypothetical protein
MTLFLILIPFLTIVSGMLMYRLNGKREILRMDMVQFFYSFVLAPMLFIWGKSFLYVVLRTELDISLSRTQLFVFDTLFSLVFLYIFAFIVIHSLTKSFNLRTARDPLYDIFLHSEYFHLWLSHIVIYIGGMLFMTIMATANIFFPLAITMPQALLYGVCAFGVVGGAFTFLGVLLSDPKQSRANFMRMMKVLFGLFFLLHAVYFFIFNPLFSAEYAVYWWTLFFFATIVTMSFFSYRSERARSWFDRISDWFKHHKWDMRLDVFDKK